ncbi:MAG: transmembrane 220 family protein [Agriterribacter sp.]
MKIFNIIFCLLFIFSAALQYNDPDPYVWMPIYMYGAVLCWLAAKNKYYPTAYLTGVAVFTLYAIYKFVEKNGVWDWVTEHNAENIAGTMKASAPWIEDTREFFGLAILIAVLLIDYFHARKRKRVIG